MERHLYRTILIFVVLAGALVAIYPTAGWMTLSPEEREARLQRWSEEDSARAGESPNLIQRMWRGMERWAQYDRDWVITLGLDLQGGVHMVVGFDPEDPEVAEQLESRELAPDDVQEIILQRVRNRIDEFEAQEPVIQKLGNTQVQIQLPGEKDIQRATNLIMRTAFLTFHMVSGPDETERVYRAINSHFDGQFVPFLDIPFSRGGPYQIKPENFDHVRNIVEQAIEVPGLIPEDKTIAFSAPPKPWEQRGYHIYLMDKDAAMTGEGLTTAVARPDPQRPAQWQIIFTFGSEAARQFAELTGNNIGRNMAIVLDDRVVSAPNINDRIFGTGNITGSFTAVEAKDLAISLNSGSMPVPIKEEYSGVVGPTLGRDSIEKGVRSSAVGFVAVMIFMIVYYRAGGIIANIALLSNAILVVAALAYFNATLTLPGIAGLILTIGMAVDANVLIFERIREELRLGKSLASAVEGGYARATVTILDANVTTLIAAAVLTQFGTGPVQGFAVTLSIGIVSSVFTALVVTRAVLDFITDRKLITNLNMASWFKPDSHFDFMGKRRIGAIVSVVAITIGLVVFAIRGSDNFGVDFTHGTNMTVALNSDSPVAVGDIRAQLAGAGFTAPTVQELDEDPTLDNEFVIRIGVMEDVEGAVILEGEEPETVSRQVQRALLPLTNNPTASGAELDDQVVMLRVETVGPAVGRRLQRDAMAAVFYSLLFIMAYLWFRFEFKFAVAAAVALVHDITVTVGVFALLGRELTIPVVAALLTIIGYSLNDTIIVFDRIREDLKLNRGRNKSYLEILNMSINETLGRTILTSTTTLFVVIVLYLFGGNAINSFALALIVGIIVGTYSSIFIASPFIHLWQQWRERRLMASMTSKDDKEGPRRPSSKKKRKKKQAGGEEAAPA